jgi:hypothetical protein
MRRLLLAAAFLVLATAPAAAQSTPQFTAGGQVFGFFAPSWNQFFGAKVDVNGGTAHNLTLTGTVNGANAQLILPTFSSISATQNLTTLPLGLTGWIIQAGAQDGVIARAELDSFGNTGVFTCRRADGTNLNKTVLVNGDEICSINAWGYNGSASNVGYTSGGRISFFATGTWSLTSTPLEIRFSTTPVGSVTLVDRFHVGPDGGFYADGVTGGSKGAGTGNFAGLYINNVALSAISTPVSGANGGTGIANTGSTLSLNGAHNYGFTASVDTTVTLPAGSSSTLASLAGTEALTNKTINGLTITTSTGTLTVANGKVATINNTLTFTGTDGSSVAFGAGGTIGGVGYASNGQVPGVASNTAATAGNFGEIIKSVVTSGSAVPLVSSTSKTVTSITLTAGEWNITGCVYILPAATTSTTTEAVSIGDADNTFITTPGRYAELTTSAVVTGGVEDTYCVPAYYLSLSGNSTKYLIANAAFSVSTASAFGYIQAVRIH